MKTYTQQKRKGVMYYRCEECGVIGNVKQSIVEGLCHKKTRGGKHGKK
jgi:hypothetical protein